MCEWYCHMSNVRLRRGACARRRNSPKHSDAPRVVGTHKTTPLHVYLVRSKPFDDLPIHQDLLGGSISCRSKCTKALVRRYKQRATVHQISRYGNETQQLFCSSSHVRAPNIVLSSNKHIIPLVHAHKTPLERCPSPLHTP